jgi:hypothetical protein
MPSLTYINKVNSLHENLQLLRDIREEVILLLFNQYVFRTHQEIVRRNPELTGNINGVFSNWMQGVYAQATAAGVRRLTGSTYQVADVNLIRFFDALINSPEDLYPSFACHFKGLERNGSLVPGWESAVCRQLVGEDRSEAIRAAEKTNRFASKRVAHKVPGVPVRTRFSDLDESIEVLTTLTRKYSTLACSAEGNEARAFLGTVSPGTAYAVAEMRKNNRDLRSDMKSSYLPTGWENIFLEPWSTPETLALSLGEMKPPKRNSPRDD